MQGAECWLEFFKQNPPCHFHAGFILVPCAPDASHVVSQCHESLGAERIRALHDAWKCHVTLSAERMQACHMVSQCHETLGVEHIRAFHVVSQCYSWTQSDCTPKKSAIDMVLGRQRQTVPLAP